MNDFPLDLIEFPADDPERARRFWFGLLGAKLEPRGEGEGSGWQTPSGSPRLGLHARGVYADAHTGSVPRCDASNICTADGVSMLDLAAALGEQHGLAIHSEAPTRQPSRFTDDWLYEVGEPTEQPGFRTDSFLEATDFAFEYLTAESPPVLEIVRQRGTERESVWQCDQRGEPLAAGSPSYGFDPNAWTGPKLFGR